MSDLDLKPSEFRPVYDRPLGNRVFLVVAMIGTAAFAGMCLWLTLYFDRRLAFTLIPPCVIFGICFAGLAPGLWFNRNPNAPAHSTAAAWWGRLAVAVVMGLGLLLARHLSGH